MDAVLAKSLRDVISTVSSTFYGDCVTFEMATERNVDGFLTTEWIAVPHPRQKNEYLVDLLCCLAPDATIGGQSERRLKTHTRSNSRQKLALVDHYPNITTAFRAVVNGKVWDITGIVNDNKVGMLLFLDETSA